MSVDTKAPRDIGSVGQMKHEMALAQKIAKVIWATLPEDEKEDCVAAAWRVLDVLREEKLWPR